MDATESRGPMLKPSNSQQSLRPHHGVAIAVGIVVAAVIAFGAFHFILGTIAFLVKLAIVLGLAYVIVRVVLRSARR